MMLQAISDFWQNYAVWALSILLGTPILFLFFEWLHRDRNPRQIANREILRILHSYVETNPDQRFGQILRNIGIVEDIVVPIRGQAEWETGDVYWERGVHEESMETLLRILSTLKELEEDGKDR